MDGALFLPDWKNYLNQLLINKINEIMKTMKCRQLGGACDKEFHAETFEKIAEMSKKHGMKMFQKKDKAHMAAMEKMQEMMQKPEVMQEWFKNKRKEFESLPENK